MHRTPLPNILIALLIFAGLPTFSAFGQVKAAGEVDVTKCWSYHPEDSAGHRLSTDGTRVFVALDGAAVEALSLEGKLMWRTAFGGDVSSNILPVDNALFVVTSTIAGDAVRSGDGILRSISKETGITNWTLKMPEADEHFLAGFNGAIVIVSKSGVIQSIDAKSGTLKWKREITQGFASEPAFDSGKVFVATRSKQIFGVALSSGEIDSMRKLTYDVTSIGEMSSGELLAGDDRGNLSLISSGSEKPYWRFKSGGEISRIFAIGDHILITSHDNFVYFLTVGSGSVVWKKRLSGRVSEIGSILGRFALVSTFDEHSAVLTDLSNGKVAGQIALGPDEILVDSPISSNGLIFLLTNAGVYGFSLNGCPPNKDSGNGQAPVKPLSP